MSLSLRKSLKVTGRTGGGVTDYLTPLEPDFKNLDKIDKHASGKFRKSLKQTTAIGDVAIETLLAEYKSNEQGLTDAVAAELLIEHGKNELKKPTPPGLFLLFVMQLTNIIIILLICSACASFAVAAASDKSDEFIAYVEGIAIFLIVIINAGIAAVTENDANNALDALSKLSQAQINVMRGGVEKSVPSLDLVPGDIVMLLTGDICPADVRLITADELKVNEMLLTGEPDDVAKSSVVPKPDAAKPLTPKTMAFSSCTVTNGKATALVVLTGMNTRVGEIAKMLTNETGTSCGCLPDTSGNQTPLQAGLNALSMKIGYAAILTCVIVFAIGLALQRSEGGRPSWLFMILIAVTLAVAAIPEGIPLCVTISLSKGCSAMVDEHVLVRKLAAVETLGSASVICTDKTGTLTEGKMTMVRAWAAGQHYNVTGHGFDPSPETGKFFQSEGADHAQTDKDQIGNDDKVLRSLLYAGMLCSNCKIVQETDGALTKWVPKGNSSEAPIVVAGRKLGLSEEVIEQRTPRTFEIPFSSARKMMMVVNDSKNEEFGPGGMQLPEGSKKIVTVKGAPNFIIERCTTWTDASGKAAPFPESKKAEVLEIIDALSEQALRVLAVAIAPKERLDFDEKDQEIESAEKFDKLKDGLQLLGLFASIDPARKGVDQAVADANMAHIRVVMITGDYVKTAVAIAKNINIIRTGKDGDPVDNPDICAMDSAGLRPDGEYKSDEEIDRLTASIRVFARAQPEDKLEIVKSLKRQQFVVAMTGDGVNDAPALNEADIGVAMGIQGTEVAKGAAEMILTDDNFCSIVKAIEKGRVIYCGIQKFVAFIMSVHIGEVLQIFLCIVIGMPVMRIPLQILFLILVTDLPPSIALGMEPGQPGILKERPRPKAQPIVLNWMWVGIVVNGSLLTLVAMVIYTIALELFVGEFVSPSWSSEAIAESIQEQMDNGHKGMLETETDTSLALVRARTSAFVCVVWCENFRAYTSRSFNNHVWVDTFSNTSMQKAILMAQIALYLVIFIPGLNTEVMNLDGASLGWEGWCLGIGGGVACLILCEMYKPIVRWQINAHDKVVLNEQIRQEQEQSERTKEMQAQRMAENLDRDQKKAEEEKKQAKTAKSIAKTETKPETIEAETKPEAAATADITAEFDL